MKKKLTPVPPLAASKGGWFEREMPGPATMPLFDEARRLGVGFHFGYCELDTSGGRKRRFNSSILVASRGPPPTMGGQARQRA